MCFPFFFYASCQSPCTEGKDGITAKVATWRDIRSKEAFEFLNELPFGGIFFPLGEDPLPPKINSGDLDGDLYQCILDSILIGAVQFVDEDTNLGKIVNIGHSLLRRAHGRVNIVCSE